MWMLVWRLPQMSGESVRSGRNRITNGMVRRLYPASSRGIRGERRSRPMELHTIGIDLGKTVFHLVGVNLRGEVVVRKKFSRKQLLHFTANLRVKLIGMEACGGPIFLAGRCKSKVMRCG